MKNRGILFILFLLVAACKRDNIITQNQWGDIFKKYQIDSACFELADNTHDRILIYNLERASKRFSPASTFKIFNSLVALETSVVKDESMVLPWDKVARKPEWDKDMDMREAFKVSCVPFYQEIARRIGATEMQKALDTVRYGNKRMGGAIDQFWLNDTLSISPDEQVGFVKKLYFDKLPFSQRSHRIVRSIMLHEDSTDYKLYYKTGTQVYDQKLMAWVVGFVERRESQIGVKTKTMETNFRPYFFAMNYETKDTSIATLRENRIKILKEILREQKIID